MYTQKQQIRNGLIVSFCMIVLAVFLMSDSKPETVVTEPTDVTICAQAYATVELALKSPSTADFPTCRENRIMRMGDRYVVTSYVDSQNSFGAQVRTPFQVYLHKTGDNSVASDDIVFSN